MVFKQLSEISKEHQPPKLHITSYFHKGQEVTWDGETHDVVSPILLKKDSELREEIIGSFPYLTKEIALEILDDAFKAYNNGTGAWPRMSIEKRLPYFYAFIDYLKQHRDEIINVLMWEIAKNKKAATKEFDRTMEYIIDSINALKNESLNSSLLVHSGFMAQTTRSPLGVVLSMGPYNYPLNETFTTIIPALLMGNTVIVKPPQKGGLVYYYVAQAVAKSFPPGVFNILYGSGRTVIAPLMESGKISAFAFIGSYKAANRIFSTHPRPNRVKTVYGLDANNVGIVLKDADINSAVEQCVLGSLSYNGQRCTALKLIYVHKDIAQEFVEKFSNSVDNLSQGLPFDNTSITPVFKTNVEKFQEFVTDAISKGAKIVNSPRTDVETFFSPKVLYPVTKKMNIFAEEQFGPVVPIAVYDDVNEPIQAIIDSEFGQQCAVFGKDSQIIGNLIDKLVHQVSRININGQCQRGPDVFPFTGRKDSAVGTLSVTDAFNEFSIKTIVSHRITEENKKIYKEIQKNNYSDVLNRDPML